VQIQIVYTVDVSDAYRRAINIQYKRMGCASRAQVREWVMAYGTSRDAEIMSVLADVEPNQEATG
jgi:metal-sulfur cluster biosynthetic enzyme